MTIVNRVCAFCGTKQDLELRNSPHKCIIKGKIVEYMMESLVCFNCDNEFWTGEMLDKNLVRARNAYNLLVMEASDEKEKNHE